MRWENGFHLRDHSLTLQRPSAGFNWGLLRQVKNAPIQAGVGINFINLAHKDWIAPFRAGGIMVNDAEYCATSNMVSGEFLLRYEKKLGSRLIPYAEAGTGIAYLMSDLYVYENSSDNRSEPTEIGHGVISRDLGLSASAGAGLLIKVLKLHKCCDASWADLYLDIYGGGRKTTGTYKVYEGEGFNRTENLNQLFFRFGINVRFADVRNNDIPKIPSVPSLN